MPDTLPGTIKCVFWFKMAEYIHKGVVKTNGIVDISQSINDSPDRNVLPSDDSFHLTNPEIGNFEWWYFDIIDEKTNCIVKIVVHLGTDPLRKRVFPKLAISVKTPNQKHSLFKKYSLGDFNATTDYCNVRLKDEFHVFVESSGRENLYHLVVNINEFRCNFTFIGEIEGWKPLGNEVKIEKGMKKGSLFWVVPIPKAKVIGVFSFGNEEFKFHDALGYHDHNYWKVDVPEKLFLDDVISHWYWGRFLAKNYSIIFMETYLKKHPIKSLMIAEGNNIIHSSNNLIEVMTNKFEKDEELKTFYPSRITVRSIEENNSFQMILNAKEIIDKRDLLEGINPFIKWLIKLVVSRPAYFGILAESAIKIADKEIKGTGMYELMSFRSKNTAKRQVCCAFTEPPSLHSLP